MFKRKPKIIQITYGNRALYGLDQYGRAYRWSEGNDIWYSLVPFGRPIEVKKRKKLVY